mmetsp:Transcript_29848/g.48141  ORF Transcript_29848/g.48141 Transcript_29848/m.48141 type:complete len:80 (+) Transcript_29848:619-858(+)
MSAIEKIWMRSGDTEDNAPDAVAACARKSFLHSRKHSEEEKGSPTQSVVFDLRCMHSKIFSMMPANTAAFLAVREMDCV